MNKKILFGIFLAILMIPNMVSAETCKAISGTGKNVGDLIKCGTEEFYVISNNNENIKMLTKYNLNVGYNVTKDTVESDDWDVVANRYNVLEESGLYDKLIYASGYNAKTGATNKYFIRRLEKINSETILQSSGAIGLEADKNGNMVYPSVGVEQLKNDENDSIDSDDIKDKLGFKNHPLVEYESVFNKDRLFGSSFSFDSDLPYGNLDIAKTNFYSYLTGYRNSLTNLGYSIKDVGLLTIPELESVLKETTGNDYNLIKNVSQFYLQAMQDYVNDPDEYLSDYYDSFFNSPDFKIIDDGNEYFKYSLTKNNIINDKNKWLLNTSYWLGTMYTLDSTAISFVTTVGDFCSDVGCGGEYIGLGVRPVVTISSTDIEYRDAYSYEFINGENQSFNIDGITNYSFKIDGDYSLFKSLTIGSLSLVKDVDFTVSEGSTIIRFTDSGLTKLKTLKSDTYDVVVEYTNNKTVTGKLTINNDVNENNNKVEKNPQTYDGIMIWLVIFMISVFGIIGIIIYNKKSKKLKE